MDEAEDVFLSVNLILGDPLGHFSQQHFDDDDEDECNFPASKVRKCPFSALLNECKR